MRRIAISGVAFANRYGAVGSVFGQGIMPRTLMQLAPGCGTQISENTSFPSLGTRLPQIVLPSRSLNTTTLPESQVSSDLQAEEADKLYSLVEVECRSHEPAVLRSYQTFVSATAAHLEISVQDILWPKKQIYRWTLLKSVHVHKHHRVQYEVRTHFLIMKFARLTGSTADTFLEYIQRNLPEGVSMKVTTHELQKLPQHVKPSSEVIV